MPSASDGHVFELEKLEASAGESPQAIEEIEETEAETETAGGATMQTAHDNEQDALIGAHIDPSRPRGGDDHRLDRQTVRKLDAILLPFLALLFLLNSLDKSNIGNAETAGFTYDTGLSRGDVNVSMAVFFFVFVLLQPVGAALGRRFGMRRYVPACMTLWGLSTILHIFVRKKWHLIMLRIMIAVLESGFYPTTVSYMSLFYTKYEFAFRLGFFYGMTAVAGMLGGVLSWAVFSNFPGHEDDPSDPQPPPPNILAAGPDNWKSWEILFLIEGCMTMTVAVIGFIWLPHSADSAWFLSSSERSWAERRMQLDASDVQRRERRDSGEGRFNSARPTAHETGEDTYGEAHTRLLAGSEVERPENEAFGHKSITQDSGLTRQDILSAVFSYKIWHLLFVNILSAIPATAFGVLLPILVKELSPALNLTPAASNLLSAPPFAFGAIVLFAFTIWSDRARSRLTPILWGLVLLLVGLAMAVLSPVDDYWLRYASLCVLLSGSFIASPLTVAWLANNTPEPGKRAILLGLNGWGNLAGCFMSLLFTPEGEKTGYLRSFVVLLICVWISFAGFVAFRLTLVRENRFRDNVVRSWSEEEKQREEERGDVPAPFTFGQTLAKRLGLLALAQRLGMEDTRSGDELMTYKYSL